MAKVNQTGRSISEGRFVKLPHAVMNSPGYAATRPPARAVLLEIAKRYTGFNNGSIGLSIRDAHKACRISTGTVGRAIQELEDCGLIECVEKGSFSRRRRLASEYRLLWQRCDLTSTQPARRYMQLRWLNDEA